MKIFECISCFPFCHFTYPQEQRIKTGNSVKCMVEESLEKSGIREPKRKCYWTIVAHLIHYDNICYRINVFQQISALKQLLCEHVVHKIMP